MICPNQMLSKAMFPRQSKAVLDAFTAASQTDIFVNRHGCTLTLLVARYDFMHGNAVCVMGRR